MPLTRAAFRFLQPLLALGLLAVVLGLASYQAFLGREVAQVAEVSRLRLEFYRRTLTQTLEEFRLLLSRQLRKGHIGGQVLREHLPEQPQLGERGDRVLGEVPLRQRPEGHQQRIVLREEAEVGRDGRGDHGLTV